MAKKVFIEKQKAVFYMIKRFFYGKRHGYPAEIIAKDLNMDKRELRRVCAAINANPEINGIISTSNEIYVCETKEECQKAINNTYRMAFAYLKKARAMEKKVGLNGQYEFTENGKTIKIVYEE